MQKIVELWFNEWHTNFDLLTILEKDAPYSRIIILNQEILSQNVHKSSKFSENFFSNKFSRLSVSSTPADNRSCVRTGRLLIQLNNNGNCNLDSIFHCRFNIWNLKRFFQLDNLSSGICKKKNQSSQLHSCVVDVHNEPAKRFPNKRRHHQHPQEPIHSSGGGQNHNCHFVSHFLTLSSVHICEQIPVFSCNGV